MLWGQDENWWHLPCLGFGMVEGLFSSQNYQIAKAQLEAAHMRHQALARNIANLNTPGFKRVDLNEQFDFELKRAVLQGTQAGKTTHLNLSVQTDPDGGPARPDGNNVRLDKELVEVNRNALEYRLLTQRVDGTFKRMKTAITGRTSG